MLFNLVAQFNQFVDHANHFGRGEYVFRLLSSSQCLLRNLFLFLTQRFPTEIEFAPELQSKLCLFQFVVLEI